MNQGEVTAALSAPAPSRRGGDALACRTGRWARRGWAVLCVAAAAGCTGAPPAVVAHRAGAYRPVLVAPAAGSLVRVPVADYASPASVAAAFYVAWAGVDTVHDTPGAVAGRCARLATPQLEAQLAASQPASAAWAAMRRDRTVSLVRVQAVTQPDGAPAPTPSLAYLRVYADRVTTSTAGRTDRPDGVTVQMATSGGRWLVARVLFF